MGWIMPAIMGIGLLNSIFNKPKTQKPNNPYPGQLGTLTPQQLKDLLDRFSNYGSTTTGASNTAMNSLTNTSGWNNAIQNFNSMSAPQVSPMYQPLEGSLVGMLSGRMAHGALPPGFAVQGTQGINHSYDVANQALQNRLTSSGMGGSEIYGAGQRYLEGKRAGDIGTFNSNLPLVQRQLQNEDFGMAQGLIDALGKGTRTSGMSTTRGTSGGTSATSGTSSTNTTGNTSGFGPPQLPGGFFQPNQNPQSGLSGMLGGLAGMLPFLMYLYGQQGSGGQTDGGGGIFGGGYNSAGG